MDWLLCVGFFVGWCFLGAKLNRVVVVTVVRQTETDDVYTPNT